MFWKKHKGKRIAAALVLLALAALADRLAMPSI